MEDWDRVAIRAYLEQPINHLYLRTCLPACFLTHPTHNEIRPYCCPSSPPKIFWITPGTNSTKSKKTVDYNKVMLHSWGYFFPRGEACCDFLIFWFSKERYISSYDGWSCCEQFFPLPWWSLRKNLNRLTRFPKVTRFNGTHQPVQNDVIWYTKYDIDLDHITSSPKLYVPEAPTRR